MYKDQPGKYKVFPNEGSMYEETVNGVSYAIFWCSWYNCERLAPPKEDSYMDYRSEDSQYKYEYTARSF